MEPAGHAKFSFAADPGLERGAREMKYFTSWTLCAYQLRDSGNFGRLRRSNEQLGDSAA
jgi:hypothetical protein